MTTSNSAASPTLRSPAGLAVLPALVLHIPVNLARWIAVLVRSPRARLPRIGPGAFAVFAVVLAVIIASMFWFDTKAIELARREPLWLHDFADEITNYGRSSTFVYPFGIVLLALAAVLSPWLTKISSGRPGRARRSLRLPVRRDRSAEPVRDRHQAADRPRAALCRRPRRSVRLHAVHLEARIRQHALRSCDDCGGGGNRHRRGLAAAPAVDVDLCARHHGEPHPDLCASSERRARRRGGRRDRCAVGAPLVRGPSSRFLALRPAALCVAVATSALGNPQKYHIPAIA